MRNEPYKITEEYTPKNDILECHGETPKCLGMFVVTRVDQKECIGCLLFKKTLASFPKQTKKPPILIVEKPIVKTTPYQEIVPRAKIANRVKKPHFVNDPYQWANETYGKWKSLGREPKKSSSDYGLYKYGEWLANNETFTSI